MSMLAAMMGGGALPPLGDLIKLPCALCLARLTDQDRHNGHAPADAVTLAAGTLVCADDVRAVLLDVLAPPGVRRG